MFIRDFVANPIMDLPPTKEDSSERRHIVSVFKLVQDLLESLGQGKKTTSSS